MLCVCTLGGCIKLFDRPSQPIAQNKSEKHYDYTYMYYKTPVIDVDGKIAGYQIKKSKTKKRSSLKILPPPQKKTFWVYIAEWFWFLVIAFVILFIISPGTAIWLLSKSKAAVNKALTQMTEAVDEHVTSDDGNGGAKSLKDLLHKSMDSDTRTFVNKNFRGKT